MSATLPIAAAPPLTDADDARLAALRRTPESAARAAAAKELEVLFLAQLLAAMRKTVPESDFLPRAPERSVYDGMFDRAVAEAMAAGDPLGLVPRLGNDGLKIPNGRADTPVGSRQAAVRGSSDEGQ